MLNNQMSLFDSTQLLEGEELLQYQAKLYVVRQILRSCSNRRLIRNAMEEQDRKTANKWFVDSCRTYGFSFPRSYSFMGFQGIAEIRYYHNEEEFQFKISFSDLFNFMIDNYIEVRKGLSG